MHRTLQDIDQELDAQVPQRATAFTAAPVGPAGAVGHAAPESSEECLHGRTSWSLPDAAAIAVVAALSGLAFWAMHHALVDDAYITLVYARNLAEHGEWGLLAGRTSNTATSPFNVLVLGLFTALTGGAVRGLAVVYVLNAALLALGLLLLGRTTGLGRRLALIGGTLLAVNPLLVSTAGLETTLAVTALVFLLWSSGADRAWLFGVVAGLTVLIRLDLVVVVAVVALLRRPLWRRLPRAALWAAVVALPWFLFSWFALGSLVPDTLLIKTGHTWGDFATGLVGKYGPAYPLGVLGTLVPAALGLVAVLTWRLWRAGIPGTDRAVVPIAGTAALAYYLTFVLLGVSPFFWYYGVPVAGLVLAAGVGISALTWRSAVLPRLVAAGLALVVAFAPAAVAWGGELGRHVPLRIALVKGNWAQPWQYARIGRALSRVAGRSAPVTSPGEIGTLLFFCRCDLVDKFSDRARLVPEIDEYRRTSLFWRANYHWLDTRDLRPVRTEYHLKWERGHDPSGRGWDVDSKTGHKAPDGYIALLEPSGSALP